MKTILVRLNDTGLLQKVYDGFSHRPIFVNDTDYCMLSDIYVTYFYFTSIKRTVTLISTDVI